jgi:hypothetical protein
MGPIATEPSQTNKQSRSGRRSRCFAQRHKMQCFSYRLQTERDLRALASVASSSPGPCSLRHHCHHLLSTMNCLPTLNSRFLEGLRHRFHHVLQLEALGWKSYGDVVEVVQSMMDCTNGNLWQLWLSRRSRGNCFVGRPAHGGIHRYKVVHICKIKPCLAGLAVSWRLSKVCKGKMLISSVLAGVSFLFSPETQRQKPLIRWPAQHFFLCLRNRETSPPREAESSWAFNLL